jgi:TolB protein
VARLDPPFLLLLLSVAAACAEDTTGPDSDTGALEVSVTTEGGPVDPDGYALSVDQGPSSPLGANATITVADLTSGVHSLSLSGLAANCALDGPNPLSVTIPSSGTLRVALRVDCGQVGGLEIVTTTSGGAPDLDGYAVTVDAGSEQTVASTGSVTVTGLVQGEHQVQLGGVAANCSVAGTNPRRARVVVDQTARVSFGITCPGPGAVKVSVHTTGQGLDPDGYTVALDSGAEVPLAFGAEVTVEGVPAGEHTVALDGVATNCAVAGTNPIAVAVRGDETSSVVFGVACAGEPGTVFNQMLFTRNGNGSTHLYRMNADGSGIVDLGPVSTASGGRWSPDGTRILFSLTRDGNSELFAMDADGSNVRRLTHTAENEIHAVWSPDGSRIAASVSGNLRVMNADGSGGVTLGPGDWPSWSPDGTRIAFTQINPGLHEPLTGGFGTDIVVVAADGSSPTNLTRTTNAFLAFAAPSWSPDGTQIAFWKQAPASPLFSFTRSLVVLPATGGVQRTLVRDGVVRGAPVWAPNGRSIAFAHQTSDANSAVWVVATTAGEITSLTPGQARDIPTSWH